MKQYAVLKSKVGDMTIRSLGEDGNEHVYVWNKNNNWTLNIPIVLAYTNVWGKMVVSHENFAQHLLDNVKDTVKGSPTFGEPIFELVEVEDKPPVETKPAIKKNKKEKKDEEVV